MDSLAEIDAHHFTINPVVQRVMHNASNELTRTCPGFHAITLFGSQATGRYKFSSDVDYGIIAAKEVLNTDTGELLLFNSRRASNIISSFFGKYSLKPCKTHSGGLILLNLSNDPHTYISELNHYANILQGRTLSRNATNLGFLNTEVFPFCLPFGINFGNEEAIRTAQEFIINLISQTEDPELTQLQLNRVLELMYGVES
ncbi:nucleotidyltransferase domain-containing protein [Candidatus Woesebacteria bacterium]|nr:nucleotidyltransferase domain-containing protein [Candidatus Woesebacteria bacterium]